MRRQGPAGYELETRWVGGLPLINAVLDRLHVAPLLAQALPGADPRTPVPPGRVLGVVVRNIVCNARRPVYSLPDWIRRAEPALLGVTADDVRALNDDRLGRALDHLFRADRAALLTALVLRAVHAFQIDLDQLHNDSTSVTFSGAYTAADGRPVAGIPTVRITHGHNKDHRPDFKQLLFVLTVAADGAVPVHVRVLDGNTEDSTTHIATWEMLCKLAGKRDFLYVADSKLCAGETLAHIDQRHGRFITVLPRSRREDRWFRQFVQTQVPAWAEVLRRPHPRRRTGPEDVWRVVEAPLPSKEGYRIIWVWNSLMAAHDAETRQARIERAWAALQALQAKLAGPRCRLRSRTRVEAAAKAVVHTAGATPWIAYELEERRDPLFRQERRGRPGHTTRYVRGERVRFTLTFRTRSEAIKRDAQCDGLFPLLTNCPDLTPKAILEAYKFQPRLEKRLEELKSVEDVRPVFLKTAHRIEALLFLYFIALLVQALLERDVRLAMARTGVKMLPLYPEQRKCRAPTTARILEEFALLQRHRLYQRGQLVQTFEPELTALHHQILSLLDIPASAFQATT
jgi:transposase